MRESGGERSDLELQIEIPAGAVRLPGELVVPGDASGTVVFAHGSGSGRLSPRNRAVAGALQDTRLATLLFDLLTEDEAQNRALVFDISLLADRLVTATRWLSEQTEVRALPVGYFGASTGAAAALQAAAEPDIDVSAIVSRGGRPDLAGPALSRVTAPTLLIVGGADPQVLALNGEAQTLMRCPNELVVIPGASHLFEEPGALESVAEKAAEWFQRYLGAS